MNVASPIEDDDWEDIEDDEDEPSNVLPMVAR